VSCQGNQTSGAGAHRLNGISDTPAKCTANLAADGITLLVCLIVETYVR